MPSTTEITTPRMRLPVLDGLHALGIVLVVLIHSKGYITGFVREGTAESNAGWMILLTCGMGFLVFASGAGLALGYHGRLNSPCDVWRFLKRRWFRLYPLYLLALAWFILFWLRPITPVGVFAHLIGVEAWIYPLSGPVTMTLWFVSVLALYYVLFVLISLGSPGMFGIILRMGFIFSVLMIWHFVANMGMIQLVVYYPTFCLGILIGGRVQTTPSRSLSARWTLVSAAVLAAAFFVHSRSSVDGYHALALSLGSAASVPIGWTTSICLLSFRRLAVLVALVAYASYGMYLFHRPVLATAMKTVSLATAGLLGTTWSYVLFWLIVVPIVGLIGWLIQRGYDALLKRWQPR